MDFPIFLDLRKTYFKKFPAPWQDEATVIPVKFDQNRPVLVTGENIPLGAFPVESHVHLGV